MVISPKILPLSGSRCVSIIYLRGGVAAAISYFCFRNAGSASIIYICSFIVFKTNPPSQPLKSKLNYDQQENHESEIRTTSGI